MPTGAITDYIDVAQLALYAFWIFFAGLIYYLRREDKREGYPLESDRSGSVMVQGWPPMPRPKTFLLRDGSIRVAPSGARRSSPIAAEPDRQMARRAARADRQSDAGRRRSGRLRESRRRAGSHPRRPGQDRAAARGHATSTSRRAIRIRAA